MYSECIVNACVRDFMQLYCFSYFKYSLMFSDTAYGKNANGKWYHFDDSHVSETDENHVVVSGCCSGAS